MIKKSWQKIKYIDNEILITFKGLLVAQVCLRPGYAPLRIQKINPALPNHKYHAKQQTMNKLFKPCWSQWELFLNSCNLVLNPWFHPRWYRLSLKNYVKTIWLLHGHLWAIIDGTTSLVRWNYWVLPISTSTSPRAT